MIREAIIAKFDKTDISKRQFCLQNGIDYANFMTFLKGGKTLSLDKLEVILKALKLEIFDSNESKHI